MPILGFATNGSLVAQVWTGVARTAFGPILSISSIWHHVVQTWSSTNGLRLYVNNSLVKTDSSVMNYTASTMQNNVRLANRPNRPCALGGITSAVAYRGDIDDFRIYSRELNLDDICALYHY